MINASPAQKGERAKTISAQVIFATYLSAVCLTSAIKTPIAAFEGIPLYVMLTPIIWLMHGRRAIVATALTMSLLLGYEFLKNFQTGYEETWKAIFGLIALSVLLPTIYFSLAPLFKCSPKFIGCWLAITLSIELAGIIIDICLGGLGLVHTTYFNYFLPIGSYSGLFAEPSHVGMFISPFVFMAIFDYGAYRRYMGALGIISLIGIAFLCPSTTEMAALALAAAAFTIKQATRGHFGYLLVAIAIIAIVGIAVLRIPMIQSRITGVLFPKNSLLLLNDNALSVLVFFKGLEMARYGLAHVPLGVAFLNMAALNNYASISHLSPILYRLNSADGSSILFKGICEFGYLFLLLGAIWMTKIILHILRYDRHDDYSFEKLVALALEFSMLTFFFRSATYFQGVVPIALSALIFPSPFLINGVKRNSEERNAVDEDKGVEIGY